MLILDLLKGWWCIKQRIFILFIIIDLFKRLHFMCLTGCLQWKIFSCTSSSGISPSSQTPCTKAKVDDNQQAQPPKDINTSEECILVACEHFTKILHCQWNGITAVLCILYFIHNSGANWFSYPCKEILNCTMTWIANMMWNSQQQKSGSITDNIECNEVTLKEKLCSHKRVIKIQSPSDIHTDNKI